MHRRSFFRLGVPAAVAMAVPFSANGLAESTTTEPRLRALNQGARLRGVHSGTGLDPETDFGRLVELCGAEGWILEVRESV